MHSCVDLMAFFPSVPESLRIRTFAKHLALLFMAAVLLSLPSQAQTVHVEGSLNTVLNIPDYVYNGWPGFYGSVSFDRNGDLYLYTLFYGPAQFAKQPGGGYGNPIQCLPGSPVQSMEGEAADGNGNLSVTDILAGTVWFIPWPEGQACGAPQNSSSGYQKIAGTLERRNIRC